MIVHAAFYSFGHLSVYAAVKRVIIRHSDVCLFKPRSDFFGIAYTASRTV